MTLSSQGLPMTVRVKANSSTRLQGPLGCPIQPHLTLTLPFICPHNPTKLVSSSTEPPSSLRQSPLSRPFPSSTSPSRLGLPVSYSSPRSRLECPFREMQCPH